MTARVDYALARSAGESHTHPFEQHRACTSAHVGDSSSAKEVEVTYVSGGKTLRVRRWQRRDGVLEFHDSVPLSRNAGRAAGGARVRHQGAHRLHQRARSRLDGVREARRAEHQRARRVPLRRAAAGTGQHRRVPVRRERRKSRWCCTWSGRHARRESRARSSTDSDGRNCSATTFETFEREIRSQLGRTLSEGGFDPARDVEAITVNRWPHGYTYNYNTLADPVEWSLSTPDDRACVVGRRQFGRITIANADAAGSSHTDAAIEQAHRAVAEIIELRTSDYISKIRAEEVFRRSP